MKVIDAKGWNFDMPAAPKKRQALYFHEAEYRRGRLMLNQVVRLGLPNDWPSQPAVAWKDIDLTPPVIEEKNEGA